jgi:hypothetical protein
MRRFLVAISILAALITSTTRARACGDKLLALGRGVRFLRAYKAPHPANILMVWGVDPKHSNGGNDSQLRSILTGVGHKVMLVYDPTQIAKALQSQQFDLVFFGLQDEANVNSSVEKINNKPSLIPLLYEPSKAQVKVSKERYRRVVRVPAKPGQLLAAIDEVMDYRSRQGLSTIAAK